MSREEKLTAACELVLNHKPHHHMKISIDRNSILAMQLLSGCDESRYVICRTVNFEVNDKRCILVATDGRKLGAMMDGEVTEPSGTPESITLAFDIKMIKAMPPGKSPRSKWIDIEFQGDRRVIVAPHGRLRPRIEFEAVEGSYPRWRQVIPRGELQSPVDPCFNWRLLESFTKLADTLGRKESGIRLRQADKLSPMLVLIPSLPNFVGAVMPMATSEQADAPEWAVEPKQEATPRTT